MHYLKINTLIPYFLAMGLDVSLNSIIDHLFTNSMCTILRTNLEHTCKIKKLALEALDIQGIYLFINLFINVGNVHVRYIKVALRNKSATVKEHQGKLNVI